MPLRPPQRRRTIKTAEATDDLIGNNKIAEKIINSTSKNPKKLANTQTDETSVQLTGIPKER